MRSSAFTNSRTAHRHSRRADRRISQAHSLRLGRHRQRPAAARGAEWPSSCGPGSRIKEMWWRPASPRWPVNCAPTTALERPEPGQTRRFAQFHFRDDPHPLLVEQGDIVSFGRGRYGFGPRLVRLMEYFDRRAREMACDSGPNRTFSVAGGRGRAGPLPLSEKFSQLLQLGQPFARRPCGIAGVRAFRRVGRP